MQIGLAVKKKEQIAVTVMVTAVWTTLITADFNLGIKL